jgi:NADP-dependent 3-hydroxy acid dehydrogenase YdfG
MSDKLPKVMLVCGGSSSRILASAIARKLMESGVGVVAVAPGSMVREELPELAFSHHFVEAVAKDYQPYNDVKQLRRDMRAREKQTRKLLPKGRK